MVRKPPDSFGLFVIHRTVERYLIDDQQIATEVIYRDAIVSGSIRSIRECAFTESSHA